MHTLQSHMVHSHSAPIYMPGIGQMLISLRQARGVCAATLAEMLGTTEEQVLHDEEEGYPELTVERAKRMLAAFDNLGRASTVSTEPPGRCASALRLR